jgi:hypothetical protein
MQLAQALRETKKTESNWVVWRTCHD